MQEIILGVVLFTAVVMLLVAFILAARSRLVPSGDVDLLINDERTLRVPVGGKLLTALGDAQLFLASACGGGGTCGQCKCRILEGGGSILPTEESLISKREAREGERAGMPGDREARHEDHRARRGLRREAVDLQGALESQRRNLHQGAGA